MLVCLHAPPSRGRNTYRQARVAQWSRGASAAMSDDEEKKSKFTVQGARADVKVLDDAGTIGTRAKETDSLIARQQGKDAVLCAIKDPPIGSKNQE